MPWPLKRCMLHRLFNYQLSPSAFIGFSWVYPRELSMGDGSSIGDFNVAVNLDLITMGDFSSIGRCNWITGYPTLTSSSHFSHQPTRRAELFLGEHAAITKDHHIDATSCITIGSFSTVAGYRSQFLSHSIDLYMNRQHSDSITIGAYCFVGTNCVILGGSVLPDYSVLGASSLLNKRMSDSWCVYAGLPAKKVKVIDKHASFFNRTTGFVY